MSTSVQRLLGGDYEELQRLFLAYPRWCQLGINLDLNWVQKTYSVELCFHYLFYVYHNGLDSKVHKGLVMK